MKILEFIGELLIIPFALGVVSIGAGPILMVAGLLNNMGYIVIDKDDLILSNLLWITSIIGFTILLTCEYINKTLQ